MPSFEPHAPGVRLADLTRTKVSDGEASCDLGDLRGGTCLNGRASRISGRSVLLATDAQVLSAAAFVELDGVVRRLTVAPPDLKPDHLEAVIEDAAIEVVVTDRPAIYAGRLEAILISLPARPAEDRPERAFDTEWVLATSGTSGRPKLVAHTLAALTGAVAQMPPGPAPRTWATFYDIRRFGGLQIFFRALFGGTDLGLSRPGESLTDHLRRLGAAGVTSLSGTPSHWRRVLMSNARDAIAPTYIRLSGEIADQMVLDALHNAYPGAAIGHAYASTEAGVGFAVDDGLEGFPASLLASHGEISMKIVEGSLCIRSPRAAARYLGAAAPALADSDGFVDTGDLVEKRGERYHFVGRRGGIINVGGLKVNPEEVEAAINSHRAVRMSLVKAQRNPLTGAIVIAEIVLTGPEPESEALKAEILDVCRTRLDAHKVPALVRFVPALPLTAAGKLSREAAVVA